ncbi:hypothetical protein DRE_04602 [Drechslerella stenobrocha 248]|uniref:GDS1 winged helix domain-containing protein n=1 Tax=Drechslerella stenobrocha 248 TaxID=1043628 RepID=W7HSK3_9PEZI|nr:hypothetical protein DRE_04602 [Drechslerella stenobrocha 248]
MPYNTRRKSVSLASLGISVPASRHHRPSPPLEQPPSKRVKRVHHGPTIVRPELGPTPPPSPPAHEDQPINYESIDDDIVSVVVGVLERSGNRPHTVRELVNGFGNRSGVALIDNSANPHAIISSRLNTYLKRKDFSDDKPCVLDKELITTHPKRTYFFLTNTEHQPIPEFELPMPSRAVVSPAPTDEEDEDHAMRQKEVASERQAELEDRRRRRMPSPSPEIDFFEPDHDDLDDTTSIFSRDRSGSPPSPSSSRNSPALEGDEQEFSDNAISLSIKHRSASRDLRDGVPTPPIMMDDDQVAEAEHHHVHFLGAYNLVAPAMPHPSPIVRPVTPVAPLVVGDGSAVTNHKNLEVLMSFRLGGSPRGEDSYESWGDLKSPEAVNLQELDVLLGGF